MACGECGGSGAGVGFPGVVAIGVCEALVREGVHCEFFVVLVIKGVGGVGIFVEFGGGSLGGCHSIAYEEEDVFCGGEGKRR